MGISLTSGYHPQTNGQTGRIKQLKYLRCYCSHRPTTWANHLFLVELSHNQLHSSVTGMSPFEITTGLSPSWFPDNSPPGLAPSMVFPALWISSSPTTTSLCLLRVSLSGSSLLTPMDYSPGILAFYLCLLPQVWLTASSAEGTYLFSSHAQLHLSWFHALP